MENEKEEKQEESTTPRRKVVIETDGNNIWVIANETVGTLELKAILTSLLTQLR